MEKKQVPGRILISDEIKSSEHISTDALNATV